ncbi:transglycosylase [Mycobacterium sp. 852002-50816_SCH5313054-b]|uniref:transglycosylase n=1 Tax=Mycobacterium sp. 852002-50816_SCH5313054-b TaxID=1834092 RepID=UPI0009EF52E8|nr:transglycosylase [Mycobacterium sp. 852002-50816_SCH5313054-b]
MTQAVAALSRGHSLFVGADASRGLGDVPAGVQARADGIRRAAQGGGCPPRAAVRSGASAATLRRLAEADGRLDAIQARARADHAAASAATRLNLDAAIADAMPAADTPMGRRQTMARMAARLRAQHGHIVGSHARARLLALRLRRLRYPRPRALAVRAAIRKALDIKGIHDPVARARWERGMDLVARRESNYDAYAENNGDSNAARGTPSKGAWQFIAPTFAAYHEPGTSASIHDLVAQACAFINYARGRYGVTADASDLANRIPQADPRRGPRGY